MGRVSRIARETSEFLGSVPRVSKYFVQDLKLRHFRRNDGENPEDTSEAGTYTEASITTNSGASRLVNGLRKLLRFFSRRGFGRFRLPYLGYHHILMIICMIGIVFFSILMAGCSSTSPGMSNVFMVELSSATRQSLKLRVGHYGFCIRTKSFPVTCSNDARMLSRTFLTDEDSPRLIDTAVALKDRIAFPWFVVVAAAFMLAVFFLLATFPGWHEETDPGTGSDMDVKPFPSRPISQTATFLSAAASVLALISAVWAHVGSVATCTLFGLDSDAGGTCQLGVTFLVLSWGSVFACILVSIGLAVMVLSIRLLDELTDE